VGDESRSGVAIDGDDDAFGLVGVPIIVISAGGGVLRTGGAPIVGDESRTAAIVGCESAAPIAGDESRTAAIVGCESATPIAGDESRTAAIVGCESAAPIVGDESRAGGTAIAGRESRAGPSAGARLTSGAPIIVCGSVLTGRFTAAGVAGFVGPGIVAGAPAPCVVGPGGRSPAGGGGGLLPVDEGAGGRSPVLAAGPALDGVAGGLAGELDPAGPGGRSPLLAAAAGDADVATLGGEDPAGPGGRCALLAGVATEAAAPAAAGLVMFCEPLAGEVGGAGGSPVGRTDVAVLCAPLIGLARGAPAGGGTTGRAGRAGRGTPGEMPAEPSDGLGGTVPCDAGVAAATPCVVIFGGVKTGGEGRAGGRISPVGAIVSSTEGCAVVIDPLSPGISRSSARSTSSSSSGGSTDWRGPFPPSGAYARPRL
jgi:hypothetical protein